jgi:uracil-DNA glycosylase family 4
MTLVERIWRSSSKCTSCPLSESRQNVVFGNGNKDADILIVKASPTLAEDCHGSYLTADLKFLVRSFRNALKSRKSLDACGEILLDKAFITSAVLCRPCYREGAYKGEDRKAQPKELRECAQWLYRTVYAIDPKIIIAFGPTSVAQFKRISNTTTQARRTGELGEMFTALIPGVKGKVPYSVIPAPCLAYAETRGDYDYSEGKVLSVQRALRSALDILSQLESEDQR